MNFTIIVGIISILLILGLFSQLNFKLFKKSSYLSSFLLK